MDTNITAHIVGGVLLIILGCIGQVHGEMFAFLMFIVSINIKSSFSLFSLASYCEYLHRNPYETAAYCK